MKNRGPGQIRKGVVAVAGAVFCFSVALTASGAITFSGSGTDGANNTSLAASATFAVDGQGDLVVTLLNNYTGDTRFQADVLTAVFFSGANGLTPVSATAPSGSTFWMGKGGSTLTQVTPVPNTTPGPDGTILGQQWEYLSGISSQAPNGASAGISASGLGNIFGSGNFTSSGVMVDGTSYGLVSAGYTGNGNDGLKGGNGNKTTYFIQDSMTFVLSGFNGNLAGISDVTFQYGTVLSDSSFVGTHLAIAPEPNYGIAAAVSVGSLLPLGSLKLWCRRCRVKRGFGG